MGPGGLRALAAPIIAVSIVGMALSISHPLFALLLERMGQSGTLIGLNAMASAIAMVPAALAMPGLIGRLGVMRLLIAASVLLMGAMLLVPLWENLWYWAVLRFVIGFAATAVFFASEFWIVAAAPDDTRGRIVGIYAVVLSGAFVLGPALLRGIGIDGSTPFLAAAGLIAISIPALMWGAAHAPSTASETPPRPMASLRFFATDPALLWGVVLFGALEFGAFSLVTVWGVRTGLGEIGAINLMIALALGSMLVQVPIGWASERVDPRRLLAGAAAVSVAAPLAMAGPAPVWALYAAAFLWGGFAVALYTLALSALGARYRGARLAEGNAAVVLGYGIGALLAPAAFGAAMDTVPPDGLLWLAALTGALYLGLVILRLVAARRKSLDTGRSARR